MIFCIRIKLRMNIHHVLFFCFLSVLCAVSSHVQRQYHFVYELKTMTEAQSYCRDKYTDLATIDNKEDVTILNSMADSTKMKDTQAWIGLYDDVNSWRWSLSDRNFYKHGEAKFRNWKPSNPDNYKSEEHCAQMHDDGRWNDDSCTRSYQAVCSDVRGSSVTFVLIKTTMTWTEAQSHCRERYTDLASVRNEEENQKVKDLIPAGEIVWIGLFRDSWKWSDGSNSSFRYWSTSQPDNRERKEYCVAADFGGSGGWEDKNCDVKKAFVCYKDVDECERQPCGNGTCKNTVGSYSCLCYPGFQNSQSSDCIDIDECSTQKGLCRNGQCLNTVGSFTCQCNVGYELSVDGRLCTDINECAERPGTCGAGTCLNLNGSYSCICPPGYYLHEDTCKDINECTENPSICNPGQCTDTLGSYRCICPNGYKTSRNESMCVDVDECERQPCGNGTCKNTVGSYSCLCYPGFQNSQSSDCIDIDECSTQKDLCRNGQCLNTVGSFTCQCNVGYELSVDGRLCTDVECDDAQHGKGREGVRLSMRCDEGQEGNKTAVCKDGVWTVEDSCISTEIKELFNAAKGLGEKEVPEFVANLCNAVQNKTKIGNSSATISAIVDILNTVANASSTVSESTMQNVLNTVDAIIADDARESWGVLNGNQIQNAGSKLLGSLETLSEALTGECNISTQGIQLNRTTFKNSFSANLSSSVVIKIPNNNNDNVLITTITFSTLNNVMPARTSSSDAGINDTNNSVPANTINAAVVLVKTNASIQNITLSFDKRNKSLKRNPQCVFWNFTLRDNLGDWDDKGCKFVSDINNIVTCSCNHLTSFSILMAPDTPSPIRKALDIITDVGVGISMASLVICLIIEGYVWKAITRNSTAFMRHVSIVNITLSLLIANICFIIGAAIANPGEGNEVPVGPCSTATFFMHFFYLALFFWMLVSGLLLFYRTVMVFSYMSKSTMLAIGFSLGYGCPLIIAVITVAVTAPNGYIRKKNACWLNWEETKAPLALVIPAFTIVLINILIVIVVLFKILRRGVAYTAQSDEKHTLVVIARSVIILTPLFGLTWSLGVGTMISSTNEGIHIAFAFLNSLQGFFILMFGMLLDSKIRSLLSRQILTTSTTSNPTRSTSGGIPSISGIHLINRLRGRRYTYDVSEAENDFYSTEQSESFVNIGINTTICIHNDFITDS